MATTLRLSDEDSAILERVARRRGTSRQKTLLALAHEEDSRQRAAEATPLHLNQASLLRHLHFRGPEGRPRAQLTRLHIDTSAALKAFAEETESDACVRTLESWLADSGTLLGSDWLEAEPSSVPRRACPHANRHAIAAFFAPCTRIPPKSSHAQTVANASRALRSADGLHLACALEGNATHILTYGQELADEAKNCGITPVAPDSRNSRSATSGNASRGSGPSGISAPKNSLDG